MKLALIIGLLMMAAPALAAYSNSSIICSDNNTLSETLTVVQLNASNASQTLNASSYLLQTACMHGCDNVTKACSPDAFSQNLIFIGIFAGFMMFLFILYKWL